MFEKARCAAFRGGAALLAVLGLGGLAGCPPPAPANPKFSIIRLDPREAVARAVNEKGEVAGDLTYDDDQAFIWRPDKSPKLLTLGTLGGSRTFAYDINLYGEVCGVGRLPDDTNQAFRWTEAGGMENIGDPNFASSAYGINDRGEIVGKADGATGERAFVWRAGDGLAPVPGAEFDTWAEKINGFSQIAGNLNGNTAGGIAMEGRVWWGEASPFHIKNTLGGGEVQVRALSDTRTAAGWVEDAEYRRVAMKWTSAGGIAALPHFGYQSGFDNLPGPWIAEAYGINFRGDVVGTAVSDHDIFTAALWRDGVIYDLNAAIPQGTPWVNLLYAYDINNKGCIVGKGEYEGDNILETHAYLLVPAMLVSVSLTPVAVVGGQPVVVTALLDADAPFMLEAEAELVNLPRAAHLVSGTALFAEGTRAATFTIETPPVEVEQSGEVRVSFGGVTIMETLTIVPR